MEKIASNFFDLIGNTPLLRLQKFEKFHHLNFRLFGKLELFNPTGSIKARIAKAMMEDAKEKGLIFADTVIIEPTSGNTGIGLAAYCASKSYQLILTMPETMSKERKMLLKAYGAELVLTKGSEGMKGAIEKAKELTKQFAHTFMPCQFENPANKIIHQTTTGPEIWNALDGNIDAVIIAVGTGGTISGVGEFLKSKNKAIKIIAVEPAESPLLSENRIGSHGIQGIGAGFIPDVLNTQIYDEIIQVSTKNAIEEARVLAKAEGILAGISSGAALHAAHKFGKLIEQENKNIVVILPDTGERYLSTALFED